MPRKRKSKPAQPKSTPPPYEPPTSRGTKRLRQSSEAETEDVSNRTPTVPKTPNGLTGDSPEEQLQRVKENGSRSTKRRKRPKSDFGYGEIQFKYRIISGPGKDTPRKKMRVDRDEEKHATITLKALIPSLIDSPSAPIASRGKIPAEPSTPNPKKRQHNSGLQSHTEPRPRAPGVLSSRPAKPSRPPAKPSFESPGGAAYLKKRATEREERNSRRGEGQKSRGGGGGTAPAEPTPARARGRIQSSKTSGGESSSRQENARVRDSGPHIPAPPEPLAMGSSHRSPPVQGPAMSTSATAGHPNRIGSGEQEKLAGIMRARAEAAKKGAQAARLWAEQQKSKGKSTMK